jgi:circadian clock protein KaiC
VLTGAARHAQEARERADLVARTQERERRQRERLRRRHLLEAQIEALRAELAADEESGAELISEDERREAQLDRERAEMGRLRHADARTTHGGLS